MYFIAESNILTQTISEMLEMLLSSKYIHKQLGQVVLWVVNSYLVMRVQGKVGCSFFLIGKLSGEHLKQHQ